jgi:ribulose-5-phosphate 4-epimerase/fuculose-1-phosphate aldolase
MMQEVASMSSLEIALIDLVIANRVLAHVGAVDAYGHVSIRHPIKREHFLLSCSRSPEFVEQADIMEFDRDGNVVGSDNRPPYLERAIHAAVYAARPDVNCVAHGHARVLIPFTITKLAMKPVFLTSDEIGAHVPVWDIRSRFGTSTDLLIKDMEQGADLALALGPESRVVLLRGHGFVAAAKSASHMIRLCRALLDNAAIQLEATRYGDVNELTDGEINARRTTMADDESPGVRRGFEYDAAKVGLGHLLERRRALKNAGH